MGWWVFTVRSDLWAMVLEITGITIFMRYYRGNWVVAVLALALFAYLAWSFKQVNVFAAGAGGLFLLLRGDWRSIFLLSAAFVALVGATLLIGGGDYVENILFSITAQFTWTTYFRNLTNFLVKSGPTLFPLAVLAAVALTDRAFRRRVWESDWSVLALCGVAVTGPIISLASSKYGASEVYYLTLSYFLVLAGLSCASDLITVRGAAPNLLNAALSLGWLSFIAAIMLVLVGKQGTIDLRPHHELMMAMKRCVDPLPRPVFISHGRIALPWMAPGQSPNFVTSFSYDKERKAGVPFEAGGIAGLITSGYFKSLALYGTKRPQSFDGVPLDDFKYLGGCEKLQLFVR